MSKSVLIPIADGSEDIECVTLIDVLRRAHADVTVASVMPGTTTIQAARNTRITADAQITDCVDEAWDLIALPGGMPGADRLHDSPELAQLLRNQDRGQQWLSAVCASPARVLGRQNLLRGRRATCYPGFEADMHGAHLESHPVVIDGHLVTSRGPGTVMAFALTLVGLLFSPQVQAEIADQMLVELTPDLPG